MASGSSLSGITFTGLSSGIDTESIISRLMQLEQAPIQRLQTQEVQIKSRQTLLQQLKGLMGALSGASMTLNSAQAFAPIAAKSSNEDVATVQAGPNAVAGQYNLEVSQLATSHKISTSAQLGTTDTLNQTGFFVVNGKGISVEASDSLTTIAQKINTAQGGVTASVINGGRNAAYLTLTSATSGVDNAIQIADLSGTVVQSLGLANGGESIRDAITDGATSIGFSSSTTPVADLLGATGLGSMAFTINGVSVSVDLQTQSLAEVANTINAASTGATASVRSEDVNGTTVYHLDITGASSPTFVDTDGALKALGILQKGFGNELVAAKDAAFKLDGVSLTNSTNTVTSVIPDVTLTLLKANLTTPETATLTFSQDNATVKTKIKEFVSTFNGVIGFISQNSRFDKESFTSGVLFGDSMARQIEDTISSTLFEDVAGLSGAYKNLAQIGFSFGQDGTLQLDEAALDKALSTDPAAVGAVFRAKGQATADAIQFVSGTTKTVASGSGYYDVNISQLATKGSYTGEVAQTSATALSENLTFSGGLFGSSDYTLTIPSGSTQSAIVDLINADSRLKDLVIASVDSGRLMITSKRYGATGNFTVVSNVAAAADSSGIGTSSAGTTVTGVDVAGTINGEQATGNGQYLTGNSGNATTDGLQILYTGTSTGLVGSIRYTKGIGALLGDAVSAFTDSVNGAFTSTDKSLQDQVDSIEASIADLQDRLTLKEQSLRQKFTAMEQAIAQMQSQSAGLSAISKSG